MNDEHQLPERLSRETLFESEYLRLHLDRVRQPNGCIIERFHYIEFPRPAVGVVVENDRGQVVLCRVPRYTSMTCNWSVPAGGVEEGEDALESARREVWEETGYESFDHRLVYTYYPQQGSSNKLFQIVFCRAGERTGNFDPNEISEVSWFYKEEVESLITRGEMQDGLGLTALLLWLRTSNNS
ncbi:MAG TPA: NUDIX hydrolase [Anaerolineaceae bacterium]|nr:NUDIX hydrolase [Anaerolineaceae bacterium]